MVEPWLTVMLDMTGLATSSEVTPEPSWETSEKRLPATPDCELLAPIIVPEKVIGVQLALFRSMSRKMM